MNLNELQISTVLDIATGVGQFAHYLLSVNKNITEITCLDANENSIIEAKKRSHTDILKFVVGDAYKLSYPDNTFDAVTVSNSLHHFERPAEVLAEAKRVLKKGGYLIVSEMCSDNNQTEAQLSHVNLHHWFAKYDRYTGVFHDDTYTQDELNDFINNLHLASVDTQIFTNKIADKHNEKLINAYIRNIETVKSLILKNKLPMQLIDEADELKLYLTKHGFEPARNLTVIGVK